MDKTKVTKKFEDFMTKINDMTDGVTIKIVKEEKTLIEVDGSLIGQMLGVMEAYHEFDTEQQDYLSKQRKVDELIIERERERA